MSAAICPIIVLCEAAAFYPEIPVQFVVSQIKVPYICNPSALVVNSTSGSIARLRMTTRSFSAGCAGPPRAGTSLLSFGR
jgi:hypothetical protein